ncbi:hypothetical protein KI387_025974, partial [Taxus chinensis]
MPKSPTPPDNKEKPEDEHMKDGEEGEKEVDEIATEIAQETITQVPKKPRSKRTSGEYLPPFMGYAKDT